MTAEENFDHPCKQTCSGWRQGYERGLAEHTHELAKCYEEIERLTAALETISMCGQKEQILGIKINPKLGLIHAPGLARNAIIRLKAMIGEPAPEEKESGT